MQKIKEIFADYLEKNDNLEVVETVKMGCFTVFDGSDSSDRSMVNVMEAPDPESLARQLLWMEISDLYYSSDYDGKEPWDSDENLMNEIYYRMMPRLRKLPMEWWDEVDKFFGNPEEEE